jgi:ParB family chromosome partitioning protein
VTLNRPRLGETASRSRRPFRSHDLRLFQRNEILLKRTPMQQITTKPVNWFRTNPQARQQYDEAELRRLGESLRKRQLQPVLARTDGTIIFGERRLRAATMEGLKELHVIITDEPLTEAEVRAIQLVENVHRADFSGHEKFQACKELLELNSGWLAKDLAEHLHLDPSMVTRLLSPSKLTPEWRAALAAGTVGISDCYAASKLPEKQDQANLLAMKLSGASRDTIEQEGRKKRNGGTPAARLSRVKLAMPQGATVVICGNELGMSEVVELLAETLKEARKAADKFDVKTFESMMRDRANSE